MRRGNKRTLRNRSDEEINMKRTTKKQIRKPSKRGNQELTCPSTIAHVQATIVGQRVIVEKQSCANVEGDEDIDRVMLVAGQYEEHAEQVQHPGERVDEVEALRCVWLRGTRG